MRGPLLSGSLGRSDVLEEVARLLGEPKVVAVVGPPWLAAALRERFEVLALAVKDERDEARKAQKRAAKNGRDLFCAVAGDALPLHDGRVPALVVEGVAEVSHAESATWIAALARTLAPGGRIVALDATGDAALEARVAGVFMSAALMHVVQHRPRSGVLVTCALAPPAPVQAARFASP